MTEKDKKLHIYVAQVLLSIFDLTMLFEIMIHTTLPLSAVLHVSVRTMVG